MAPYHRISVRVVSTLLVAVLCLLGPVAGLHAQDTSPRWRAVWLDTFNTRLASPDDVTLAVGRAGALHANVLLVQVRRRGDAFYIDGSEPTPEGVGLEPGFDPLGDLLGKARTAGLEVHALVTLGPVWHLSTAPADARHVFIRHGFRNGRVVEGVDNWLTRTLQPDGNGTSVDGYRFGNDFWLDPGHPAAASYLVDLVTRLVERYPVDGLHLDALHYPEPPGGTASVGYNAVAVARFQSRTGQIGTPSPDDSRWAAWRREQVTALTRRLTVAAHAVRPNLVVSAGGLAVGTAPGDPQGTVAYARSFQDWFGWLRDGSVDVVVPQVFRAEHLSAGADEFAGWITFLRDANAGSTVAAAWPRPVVVGLGAYQNSTEGLIRQARASLDAISPQGGVAFFSLAANNAPVVNNALSVPAGRDTPQRPLEDVAAALR
ncbi:MAG TPA: family 10 glycosylhydrolase, partial [Luteitalea sp.]|nr:family 10 glycosylhydrolase [Luteitalea sp.]